MQSNQRVHGASSLISNLASSSHSLAPTSSSRSPIHAEINNNVEYSFKRSSSHDSHATVRPPQFRFCAFCASLSALTRLGCSALVNGVSRRRAARHTRDCASSAGQKVHVHLSNIQRPTSQVKRSIYLSPYLAAPFGALPRTLGIPLRTAPRTINPSRNARYASLVSA